MWNSSTNAIDSILRKRKVCYLNLEIKIYFALSTIYLHIFLPSVVSLNFEKSEFLLSSLCSYLYCWIICTWNSFFLLPTGCISLILENLDIYVKNNNKYKYIYTIINCVDNLILSLQVPLIINKRTWCM